MSNRTFTTLTIKRNIWRSNMILDKVYTKLLNSFTKTAVCVMLVASLGFTFTDCSNTASGPRTPYAANQEMDLYNNSNTYDKLVDGCGADKIDYLKENIGWETLDRLAYGTGTTNLILLINVVNDPAKLVAMTGNDYAIPPTGLGAIRVVNFLNRVDAMMEVNRYDGSPPADDDTIAIIGEYINNTPLSDIDVKVVGLMDGMPISRDMSDVTGETDIDRLDKIAMLIAHVEDTTRITDFMSLLNDGDFQPTGNMVQLLKNINDVTPLIEQMDFVTDMSRMADIVMGMNDITDLVTMLNAIAPGGGTKIAYLINNMTDVATLIYQMNNIADTTQLSILINSMEDGSSWTNQNGGVQVWDVVNGTPAGLDSGMVRLVQIMNGLDSGVNPSKLITIMNRVDDMTKMMRLIQDLTGDGIGPGADDLVSLISQFEDPAVDAVPCQNMGYVTNAVSLANITRVRELLDGQRIFGNTGNQAVYLTKMMQLMSALDNAQEGPVKISEMIDGISDIDKMIDLTNDVSNISNLSQIINGINPGSTAAPLDTAVTTLIYQTENIGDITKLISVIDNVTPGNVVSLINNVSAGSQQDDLSAYDATAAGQKMVSVIDGTTDINDLVFQLNNVSDFDKMATLMNSLSIASNAKLSVLINNTTGTNYWNTGNPATATGIGKMVNMIDNISELSALASLVDNITEIQKLSDFTNQMANSSLVVSYINAVISDTYASIDDMVTLMNTLSLADIPKVSRLIGDLNGTRDALIAAMLAPYSGIDQGIGAASMANLLTGLNDTTAAGGLATFMVNMNDTQMYQSATPNITLLEAMVRMTAHGVEYAGVVFPPLGPEHVATMMNRADSHADVAAITNALTVESNVVMIGCGDGRPGFQAPCEAVGIYWVAP